MFGNSNVGEDAPVANDGGDERQHHADDDEKDGVVVGRVAVPQTLLSLGVETVRRPAKVVWQVDGHTGHPREHYGGDSATWREHSVIGVVPADVQVAVDCDDRDGQERHEAADDTEAGCSRT